ncbi:hypothetical protein ACFW61_24435 [Streptomyces microflavus]
MGNAAHLLGILPKDWEEMTVEQADAYLDWLDQYEKANEEAMNS